MHLVDVATSMQLKSTGQVAACVPFVYQKKQKMTLYKGDAALATRRAVALKLTPSLIAALQRPRRLDDKPDHDHCNELEITRFYLARCGRRDPTSDHPCMRTRATVSDTTRSSRRTDPH